MQKEIEALVVALYDEQKRETDLLRSILAALAVGGVARKHMIDSIAVAAAGGAKPVETVQQPPRRFVELDVVNAIRAMRNAAA